MKVREKYYHLVERYLSSPNYVYANENLFMKFWNWFYKHQFEFTDDEVKFFSKYVIIPKKFKNISKDVDIYN